MIAERHRVGARGEEVLEDRLREAEAARRVLAVDDDEIEFPAIAQQRNLLDERGAPGPPDNVANEQETDHRGLKDNGFLLGYQRVEALVMALIRHGGDFAYPIGDADRVDGLH